jgi:hypothetical protein
VKNEEINHTRRGLGRKPSGGDSKHNHQQQRSGRGRVGRMAVIGKDDFPRNVHSSMPQLQDDLKKSAHAIRIRPNVLMISQLFMIRDVIPAKLAAI